MCTDIAFAGRAKVARDVAPKIFSGNLYFAYTGCTVAAVLLVTFFGHLLRHSWDEVLTRSVIALLGMTIIYAGVALAQRLRWFAWLKIALNRGVMSEARPNNRAAQLYEWFAWMTSAILVVAALVLLLDAHRRYIGIVGLLQATAIYALRRPIAPRAVLAIAIISVTTWALSAGLLYTNFSDWILNSNASALAVPAFVGSFGLVLSELCDDRLEAPARPKPRIALFVVLAIFMAFAFRSDNLLNSWVPYHRSFVADVAQLVRDGHWLLWDVPSLYGFLSVAVVAAIPGENAWQSLFILTSVILVIQSCIIFTLWRWGRTSWTNLVFALLLTLATFGEGIARYPWSMRLYPQGALRFIWTIGLLGTAFLIYVWRERPHRVQKLYWVGHSIWLMSVFWSFETAVWTTVTWIPYLVLSTFAEGFSKHLVRRLALRLWPLIVLPVLTVGVIQVYYLRAIDHGPDWSGFIEFTGLFVSGTIRAAYPTNPLGAGWCIVVMLGAVGSVGIASIWQGRWAVMPLLAATWLAVWTTSTYFAVEPFDGHVPFLLAVVMPAAAIVTFVSRDALSCDRTGFYARLSIAPIAIICISVFLGQPSAFTDAQFPLQRGWTSDTVTALPPISGELARMLARTGIRPGGPLLIPNQQYWTEISQGMLFPIGHWPGVGNVEYRAWAPISPLGIENTILGLSAKRRQLYIERFLERSRSGGWYVEYRTPAICENLSKSLITTRTLRSANYSASFCRFKASRA